MINTATGTTTTTINLSGPVQALAINLVSPRLYAATSAGLSPGIVETIDTGHQHHRRRRRGGGAFPTGLAVTPSGASLYVTNTASDTVTVIDTATQTVTDTIPSVAA